MRVLELHYRDELHTIFLKDAFIFYSHCTCESVIVQSISCSNRILNELETPRKQPQAND